MDDTLLGLIASRKALHATLDASHARRDAKDALSTISELEERVGRLSLVCTAMWELLRTKVGATDAELMALIQEVDLRDGQADGQHNPKGRECPECGRMNNLRRQDCMYCEVPLHGSALP